jgi:hypothetical protein
MTGDGAQDASAERDDGGRNMIRPDYRDLE